MHSTLTRRMPRRGFSRDQLKEKDPVTESVDSGRQVSAANVVIREIGGGALNTAHNLVRVLVTLRTAPGQAKVTNLWLQMLVLKFHY